MTDNRTIKSVTECLEYLLETDDRLGHLKASAKYYEKFKARKIKAQKFLEKTGTKDERESKAYINPEYEQVMQEKRDIDEELETIIAKRTTCELIIEVWRSRNANRRQGNI